MRVRGLSVVGAAFLTGCSLVLAGELDDAREIVILPDAGDGGASGTEASTADSANDSQVGESGPPKGCAAYQPTPKFCDDFDGNAGLSAWQIQKSGGTSNIQSEQSFSAPSAAQVNVEDVAEGCSYSRIERTFENVGTNRVSVAFRMRMQSPWPDQMIPVVVELTPGGDANGFCAALYFIDAPNGKPQSVNLDVQSPGDKNHMEEVKGYPSTDEWSEVRVVATPIPSGGTRFETTFVDPDGFSVVSQADFPECPRWHNLGLHLGSHCDHRKATVQFDDVRVDWE